MLVPLRRVPVMMTIWWDRVVGMKRRFAIPVVALGAGATACTEAIEGSWDITQAAGETMPYVYDYAGSTRTIQSTLNVSEDSVSLNTIYHYLDDDDTFVDRSVSMSGTLEPKGSRRTYGITFEGVLSGEDWTWDCGMPTADELSCTDSEGESWKAIRWPILLDGV